MSLNGGLGGVVVASKNTVLNAHASEACLVVPKSNGTDYWVILHGSITNTYYVYSLTSTGFSAATTYNVGSIGQATQLLKANSCYTQIASVKYNKTKVEVVSFNDTSGVVSGTGIQTITNFFNPEVYGAEFSPSGRFLYVTESGLNTRMTIFQFDLLAGNDAAVNASRRYYTNADAHVVRMGQLQLGPDAKIYVPAYATTPPTYLSVVPNPDVQWAASPPTSSEFQFERHRFTSKRVGEGVPAVIRSFLTVPRVVASNTCETGSATLNLVYGSTPVISSWNLGDGTTATNVTSVIHTYSPAGTYTVTVTVTDACGNVRTGTSILTVGAGAQVNVPANACPNTPVTLTGTGDNATNYTWSTSPTGTPVIGTGSTYTYNGPLPVTIYAQDPDPLATYTAGNTVVPPASGAGADVGTTFFEVFQTLTLYSFQVYSRATGLSTLTIDNEAGTTNYWTQANYNVAAANTTYTFTPNVTLSPGKYRFFANPITKFFRENTNDDGDRDIRNVIDICGEMNPGGLKGGLFLNVVVKLPNNCAIEAFTITDGCSTTLPVELMSFNATWDESIVNIQWKTESETNSAYFVVEKSGDGKTFSTVETVKGAGNSTVPLNYKISDRHPLEGIAYYKLKQVDYNGHVSYSKIVDVNVQSKYEIMVIPNPVTSNKLKLILPEVPNSTCWIHIRDCTGKTVYDKHLSPQSFNTTININDISFKSTGLYYLNVEIDGNIYPEKISVVSQ
jgi:PKD repeat protein